MLLIRGAFYGFGIGADADNIPGCWKVKVLTCEGISYKEEGGNDLPFPPSDNRISCSGNAVPIFRYSQ
jgi:hypothetical protein